MLSPVHLVPKSPSIRGSKYHLTATTSNTSGAARASLSHAPEYESLNASANSAKHDQDADLYDEDEELSVAQRQYKTFVTSLSERSLDYLHKMQDDKFLYQNLKYEKKVKVKSSAAHRAPHKHAHALRYGGSSARRFRGA